MTVPLVLKQGLVAQELPGEVGVYPYLYLAGGQWYAGASHLNLTVDHGQLVQFSSVVLPGWDNGTTTWDDNTSFWDGMVPQGWDAGATTWDGGTSVWDGAPATWGSRSTTWDNGASTWI